MTEMNTASEPTAGFEHWDCVPAACTEILRATCGAELQPLDDETDLAHGDVMIGIISLLGDVEWVIFLGLPRDTATPLAAKFAGFEIPFEGEDMGDAIGELANIFAGQVKATLDTHGIKAEISLPTVIRAQGLEILRQTGSAAKKACFDSTLGKLWVGLAVSREAGVIA